MIICEQEIHVWCAYDTEIRDSRLIQDYQNLLSESETNQYKQFYSDKDRHQYLVTRALIRTTLSRYFKEIEPKQWRFSKNRYGKPAIANHANLPIQFNLSHARDIIVLAVTLSNPVGIDVEWTQRSENIVGMANKYFSQTELEQLYRLPKQQQRDRFFELWTLKEAYIKACGKGLVIPLDQFGFHFADNQIGLFFEEGLNDTPERYSFWQICLDSFHKAALVLQLASDNHQHYSLHFRKTVPLLDKISDMNVSYSPQIQYKYRNTNPPQTRLLR